MSEEKCLVTLNNWESGTASYFVASLEEMRWIEEQDAPLPSDFKNRYLRMQEWEGFPMTEDRFETKVQEDWNDPFERALKVQDLYASEEEGFYLSVGKTLQYAKDNGFILAHDLDVDLDGTW